MGTGWISDAQQHARQIGDCPSIRTDVDVLERVQTEAKADQGEPPARWNQCRPTISRPGGSQLG